MGNHLETVSPDPDRIDQRVTLHGISWPLFEAFLKSRGDSSGVRIAYQQGELELMTPSYDHEWIKTNFHTLLFAWSEETQTVLVGAGSWTLKSRFKKLGVEPDQCYVVGLRRPKVPDIAVEIIWTSGGVDKLDLYQPLGVQEVWFWKEGQFEVHVLGKKGYQVKKRSRLLPELDLGLLAKFLLIEHPLESVRKYREALRKARFS